MRLIETSTQAFILVKFNHQGDAMSGGSLVQYMSTHGKYPNVFYPMDKGKEKGIPTEASPEHTRSAHYLAPIETENAPFRRSSLAR